MATGTGKAIENVLQAADARARAIMEDGRYSRPEQERQAREIRQAAAEKALTEARSALDFEAGRVERLQAEHAKESAAYANSWDWARMIVQHMETGSLARTAPSWAAVEQYVAAASTDAHAVRAWLHTGLEHLRERTRTSGDPLEQDARQLVTVRAQLLEAAKTHEPESLRTAREKLEKALDEQSQLLNEVKGVGRYWDLDGSKIVGGTGRLLNGLDMAQAKTVTVVDNETGHGVTFRPGAASVFG